FFSKDRSSPDGISAGKRQTPAAKGRGRLPRNPGERSFYLLSPAVRVFRAVVLNIEDPFAQPFGKGIFLLFDGHVRILVTQPADRADHGRRPATESLFELVVLGRIQYFIDRDRADVGLDPHIAGQLQDTAAGDTVQNAV